jgi:hypothetical protein
MKATSYTMHRLATDESARRAVVSASRAAPNGELADVENAVKAYETKFKMSSSDARAALSRGEMAPTQEVERWMMAVRVRDDLIALKSR